MATPPDPEGSQAVETDANQVSLKRIQVLNLVFVVAGAGLALLFSREMAYGVLLGGALMAVNLRIIVGVMQSVFGKGSGSIVNVGLYWAKFAVLMLVVGVLIAIFQIDPVGLLIGLSIFLIAISLEATARLIQS
jgi:hypothetical protein